MPFKAYGGLTHPLAPDRYYYVPDSQIVAPDGYAFEQIVGPLFIIEPNVMEVEQGAIADCYLLASLLSIVDVERGQKFVNNMMVDLKNGRVLIRLFDKDTLRPVFFELDKTTLKQQASGLLGKTHNNHKAPWVYLVEKAYAAYRLKFGGNCFQPQEWKQNDRGIWYQKVDGRKRAPQNQIEALTAGHSHDAFKILLGKPAEQINIQQDIVFKGQPAYYLVNILVNDVVNTIPFAELHGPIQESYNRVFAYAGVGAGDADAQQQAIIRAIDDFRRHIGRDTIILARALLERYQAIRVVEITLFIEQHFPGLQPHTQFSLLRYFIDSVPAKRGTEHYIAKQNAVFTQIQEALQQNKLVCIGSNDVIGRTIRDEDYRSESRVKGLLGPHAYQVLNCYQRGGLKFLLLRNPWHRYTREYVQKMKMYEVALGREEPLEVLAAQEARNRPFKPVRLHLPFTDIAHPMDGPALDRLRKSNNGIFELLLEDLTKRFPKLYICDPNPWIW